jgi:hypothetical protein
MLSYIFEQKSTRVALAFTSAATNGNGGIICNLMRIPPNVKDPEFDKTLALFLAHYRDKEVCAIVLLEQFSNTDKNGRPLTKTVVVSVDDNMLKDSFLFKMMKQSDLSWVVIDVKWSGDSGEVVLNRPQVG